MSILQTINYSETQDPNSPYYISPAADIDFLSSDFTPFGRRVSVTPSANTKLFVDPQTNKFIDSNNTSYWRPDENGVYYTIGENRLAEVTVPSHIDVHMTAPGFGGDGYIDRHGVQYSVSVPNTDQFFYDPDNLPDDYKAYPFIQGYADTNKIPNWSAIEEYSKDARTAAQQKYTAEHPYSDPADNALNWLVFDALTLGGSKIGRETLGQGARLLTRHGEKGLNAIGKYTSPSTLLGNLGYMTERRFPQISSLLTRAAPYSDVALMGYFTGHGLNNMIKEGPNAENVIETTLGAIPLFGSAYNEAKTLLNSGSRWFNTYRLGSELNNVIKTQNITTSTIPYNVGWGPRQTLSVSHASDSFKPLQLFYPARWDVVNEGANPFGTWWQGRLGIPRTLASGATAEKAEKAANARKLFADRPFQSYAELTLDKPLVTIGDVPNRSALGYQAERMGADGIIYNNVYDNGYDANQVIFSFREPQSVTISNNSKSIIKPQAFYPTRKYLTPTGNYNVPLLKQELGIGKQEALDFFNSDIYQATLNHNNALYNRLTGKSLSNSIENSIERVNPPIKIKLAYDPNSQEAAHIAQTGGDIESAIHDELMLNAAFPDVDSHVFHEMLHRGNFGKPIRPSILDSEYYENIYKPEQAFFRWKEQKLLDPKYLSEHPDNYLIGDGEGFTNMLQIGRALGLRYGQAYPGGIAGRMKVNELLARLKFNNILGKGFIADMLNRNKPKRIWDALTGQYSIIPIGILGGVTLMNSAKQEKPDSQ